jgi:hypothetical protein
VTAPASRPHPDAKAPGAGGVSRGLQRAAARDRRRVLGALADLEDRRARARAELADLDARIAELEQRVALLDCLADLDVDDAEPPAGARATVLRGAAIRRVAITHLYAEQGAGRPVHYRDWLASLEHRGYVVLGKHPPATFLSSILRSPVLVRGREPGTYFIDEHTAHQLRQELAEGRAELRSLSAVIATHDGAAPPEMREQRARLTRTVRRLERQVAESEAVLAHPSDRTIASLGAA